MLEYRSTTAVAGTYDLPVLTSFRLICSSSTGPTEGDAYRWGLYGRLLHPSHRLKVSQQVEVLFPFSWIGFGSAVLLVNVDLLRPAARR